MESLYLMILVNSVYDPWANDFFVCVCVKQYLEMDFLKKKAKGSCLFVALAGLKLTRKPSLTSSFYQTSLEDAIVVYIIYGHFLKKCCLQRKKASVYCFSYVLMLFVFIVLVTQYRFMGGCCVHPTNCLTELHLL